MSDRPHLTNDPLHRAACRSLEACIQDGRIIASPTHYADYWARDTFFAIPGLLRTGYHEVAKSSLQLFTDYQRRDGKIPRKIAREVAAIKYTTGTKIARRRLTPIYNSIFLPTPSMDENALYVKAFADYLRETGDRDFCEYQYGSVKHALDWYEGHIRYDHVHEIGLASWMDSIFKAGAVLYTNVLYTMALKKFSEFAGVLGHEEDKDHYSVLARTQRDKVIDRFWSGYGFKDEAEERITLTDTAGNLLALQYLSLDGERLTKTLETVRHLRQNKLLRPVVPCYAPWRVNPLFFLVGASDYHRSASWLWIDITHAMVEREFGEPKQAEQIEQTIRDIVNRDNEIGETYFQDGQVYNKRFWHSATPFAWSSGMVVEYLTNNS